MEKSGNERILRDKLAHQDMDEAEQQPHDVGGIRSQTASPAYEGAAAAGNKSRILPGISRGPLAPVSAPIDVLAGSPGVSAVSLLGPLPPGRAAMRSFSPNSPSDDSYGVELIEGGKGAPDGSSIICKEPITRKPALSWDVDTRRVLMLQVQCDKPYLAKFNKGQRLGQSWDMLAHTISMVPAFSRCGGVSGRACKAKYSEFMKRHRESVRNGEADADGVVACDGMDKATQNAVMLCMRDEATAWGHSEKSRGAMSEYEAKRQEQAEKMQAFAATFSSAGMMQKKRKSFGMSTATGSSGYRSEDDELSEARSSTPNNVAASSASFEDNTGARQCLTPTVDSPQMKSQKLGMAEREMAVRESDARVRQMEAATMRELLRSTHDSPNSKAKRLSIEEINAHARMKEIEVKAEETKARAEETKAAQSFMLQVMGIMGKLADKL